MIRVDEETASRIHATSLAAESIHESSLHSWFEEEPSLFLPEELLIIGHEVPTESGDRIDFLAIDRAATLVVVELKRGTMRKDIHAQALNYAAHVADWSYDDIERCFDQSHHEQSLLDQYQQDASLDEVLDDFCDDEEWELNTQQWILLVGNEVPQRTAKIATWLERESVDVTVVTFELFHDDGRLYLLPSQVIPERSTLEIERGAEADAAEWERDGPAWHRRRTTEETWDLLQELTEAFEDAERFDRLSWTQKNYVAYYTGRKREVKFSTSRDGRIVVAAALDDAVLEGLGVEDVATATGVPENRIRLESDARWPLEIDCRPEADPDASQIRDFIIERLAP